MYDRLADLAEQAGGWEGGQPLARGLRFVEEWGREWSGRSGRGAAMGEALGALCGIGERSCLGPEVVLVPPLCELRALIRVCKQVAVWGAAAGGTDGGGGGVAGGSGG